MKRCIRLLLLVGIAGTLTLPVPARHASSRPSEAVSAEQCSDQVKAALYKKFTDHYKTDTPVAYDAAQAYLQACPNDEDDITRYLKKWVAAYERELRKMQLTDLIYQKKLADAFPLGKQVLADEPENLRALIDLGYAGYLAWVAGNESFNQDAAGYAKKAVELIEAGKTPNDWKPFAGKDDTLAWLNYTLGLINLKTAPDDAISYLLKAAQYESAIRRSPSTYYFLAVAYETGPYKRQSDDYKRLHLDKAETAQSRLALESLNQVIDRVIDAYARAVASVSSDNAKSQQNKAEWMQRLTELYKFRHDNSEVGLSFLIDGVLSRPLPQPSVVSTPATTAPATDGGSTGAMPAATTPAASPVRSTDPASVTPVERTATQMATRPN
ncbi:MAG TPA: hypothetical protein VD966_01055 [Pyrinomonadaceae bacterium]|nr:hypothetical protein [Pyrinomonadaceae bacterium]